MNTQKMKEYRLKAGLTQLELAKRCSVTEATICRIERGVKPPSAGLLKDIAIALGVTMDDLWTG